MCLLPDNQTTNQMTTIIELANAVKKLRDYIANSSLQGSEAAEAYENILEFADATMKPYGLLPQKFLTYPPYTPISDDEDDEDDEDEEEEEEEDLEESLEELLNQKKYEDNKAILKLKKKFKAHKEQDALDWEHKQYEYEDEIEDLKNQVAELKQEVRHFAALEQYERTGRKPDELWTDEETSAFRVKITAHNEEAKRRTDAIRQKAADEAKLDDTLVGLIAVRQQNEFEKGEHDRPWCAEAEEQFRELLMFMPFEGKQKLQLKYNAEN